VDVVVKKELLRTGPKRMLFHKFLKQFTHENWYLSNYVPLEMMHELHVSLHADSVDLARIKCVLTVNPWNGRDVNWLYLSIQI